MDSYDENSVLLELSAYNEDDRSAFLNELAEVTWVYRALENDRIGTLGVSDKMGQSTLSLHVSADLHLVEVIVILQISKEFLDTSLMSMNTESLLITSIFFRVLIPTRTLEDGTRTPLVDAFLNLIFLSQGTNARLSRPQAHCFIHKESVQQTL